MLRFIQEHFAHVLPILLVGIAALAISVERFRALLFVYPLRGSATFFDTIRTMVLTDRIGEALIICDRYRSKPVASVIREGLMRAHQPEAMIEHGLEIAVSEANDRIRARTGFLSTIANVSTLLGLLGTILGLVQSFEAVGNANPSARSALLASGISTAMNATMLGLAVAIPCMMAYSYLMNRTNRLGAELNRAAVRFLDILKSRYIDDAAQMNPNNHASSNHSSANHPPGQHSKAVSSHQYAHQISGQV